MLTSLHVTSSPGPALRAFDLWPAGNSNPGEMKQLLSDVERARLGSIASMVRFPKGADIYRAGTTADTVFNVVNGVVKASRIAGDGSEYIAAFLFPGDVFGLAVDGRYVNSSQAITPVTAYQLPISVLRSRLSNDAGLEFHVICKLCHELCRADWHAFLLSQQGALCKLAMFLKMLEQLQNARGEPSAEIYLPMSRSDIGKYAGISLGAVSRGFHTLTERGVISSRDRRHISIVDRGAFEKLGADPCKLTARSSRSTDLRQP